MKITIYELLGMVKDDKELPKKIKVLDVIYEFDDHYGDYYNEPLDRYLFVYMTSEEEWKLAYFLNTEVEIIEEPQEHKIPKKITMRADLVGDINNKIENLNINQIAIEDKINEILDYLEVNNEETK